MRALYSAIVLLLCTIPAHAQSFEAGASVATSCIGSDGSGCASSQKNLATFGPYASVWFGDRLEVAGRLIWLERRGYTVPLDVDTPAGTFTKSERNRLVTQAEAIWHFRRGKRVRPMAGYGIGTYRDHDVLSCEPVGCEPSMARFGLTVGEHSDTHVDVSLMGGLSVAASSRIRIRGGLRYHNPFKDELAMSELFAAVGYRF